jgi:hypothetical protein
LTKALNYGRILDISPRKRYNNKVEKKLIMKRNLIIIDNIKELINNKEDLEKITFLLQLGTKIGFFFIVRTTDKNSMPQMIQNYLTKIMYFKNSLNLEISNNIRINEAFYIDKDIIERVTYTCIEMDEFEKFKDRI